MVCRPVALFDDRFTIHQDILDSARVLRRFFQSGSIFNGVGIKDDDIRHGTGNNVAAILKPQSLGRQAGQFMDRFFQAQSRVFANV